MSLISLKYCMFLQAPHMKFNKYLLLLLLVILAIASCTKKGGIANSTETKRSLHNKLLFDDVENNWNVPNFSTNRDSLVQKVLSLNGKGSEFRDASQLKQAFETHFQALQIAEEIEDTLCMISSLNNIGTDLRRTLANGEASEYHLRALELSRNNNKYLKSQAIAMNGLGNIYLSLKKPIEAQNYFNQSLEIEKQLNSHLGQAINFANLGEAMRMQGLLDEALLYYNQSLEQNQFIHSKLGVAICKNAIGQLFIKQKKNAVGLELIRESAAILKDSQDIYHLLEIRLSLVESLLTQNKLIESEAVLNNIIDNKDQIHSYEHFQKTYALITLLNKKQGNFQEALKAKEMTLVYQDSALALNNEVRILEVENRYKNKQITQQVKLLTTENELAEQTNLNQLRLFIFLFLLMVILIAFLYYMYARRKQMSLELKKINEMKSRFFDNISHEFRTPLTLIKGPLERMLESKPIATEKSDLDLMLRNTKRLSYLVEQILSLSKIDAGKFKIKAHNACISDEIKGISDSFKYQAKQKNLKYITTIERLEKSWFDPEIVEVLVTNLLSNAFKFTPEYGEISIEGIADSDNYSIYVTNTVRNISNKEIELLFNRFHTSAESHQQGTGIGLSLVKELCTLYRAKLKVKKVADTSLRFEISLPTLKTHFDESEITEDVTSFYVSKNSESERYKEQKSKYSIKSDILLVVEDSDDMRSYIASIFRDKYQIVEAKNGKEGIELARKLIPNIIISDVMMPEVNGIEMCNVLKKDKHTNHIPIILLSALTDEKTLLEGLENNADDYVTKPFVIKLLKSKVDNLIKIRKTLTEKYREEVVIKPLNLLIKNDTSSFVKILENVLTNHITESEFGVQQFCEIAAMSRTQLHRKLSATTGMSVTEFIRVHRVKIASEYLKNKELSITDICYSSGFNNTSYFSKQFKIVFGMSPKEFRKTILNTT